MDLPKVAVVGCGAWGKNLVRNFYQLNVLDSVCDISDERLSILKNEYPEVNFTSNFNSLLENEDIKAIVIATPSDTHFELALRSLQADKNVYIEKPMARDISHAKELNELATSKNLILMVGHLLLYHPAVNCLKSLIASNELGDLLYIRSDRMNFNTGRRDWSVLWDLAPHDISMMSYLLATDDVDVNRVGGWDTLNDGLIDVAYLDLSFKIGDKIIPGQIRNSWIDPQKLVRLTVNGSLKSAVLNDAQTENKLALHSVNADGRMVVEYPVYSNSEPLHLECEHFIKCLLTGQRPRTDANNAYLVVNILSDVESRLNKRPNLYNKVAKLV